MLQMYTCADIGQASTDVSVYTETLTLPPLHTPSTVAIPSYMHATDQRNQQMHRLPLSELSMKRKEISVYIYRQQIKVKKNHCLPIPTPTEKSKWRIFIFYFLK